MENAPPVRLETLFDAVLVAIGVAVAAISWTYGFGSVSRPGPGLYPFFIGLAIAACALYALVAGLRAPPSAPRLERRSAARLGMMAGTFCFWILAMPLLGYVGVTLAATYAYAKILGLEGRVKPLAIACGTALFIYLLFDVWLYIDLPRGLLS